jgi:hypothetical protein
MIYFKQQQNTTTDRPKEKFLGKGGEQDERFKRMGKKWQIWIILIYAVIE